MTNSAAQEATAAYAVGDKLYFCPSIKRMPHGSNIPAGMVRVTEVVDHGAPTLYAGWWSYVVESDGYSISKDGTQGAAEDELHRWPSN